MSVPTSSSGNTQRIPRKKSSILSLKRDRERPSVTSNAPSLVSRPKQTYFDYYPRPSTSPDTSPQNTKGREHGPASPFRSTAPSFEQALFVGKGKKTIKRAASSVGPSYAFPTLDPAENIDQLDPAGQLTPMPYFRTRSRTGPSRKSNWKDSSSIPPLRFSGSSSQTQNETPPQTPVDIEFSRSFRDRYPVVVAAPIPGVEMMDALVDGMNGFGGDDYFSGAASSRSRYGISGHHPLYQPPLPTPPPGVVLGGGKARKPDRHSFKSNNSGDDDDDDEGARSTATSRPFRRRANRASSSKAGSNSTIIAPSLSRSGAGDAGSPTPKSIDHELQQRPLSTASDGQRRSVAPSISDIIRTHAPPAAQVRSKSSSARCSSYADSVHSHSHATVHEERESDPEPFTADEGELMSRSSVDSIADEVRHTLRVQNKSKITSHPLQHAHSFPGGPPSAASDNFSLRSPASDAGHEPSIYSSSAASSHLPPSPLDSSTFPTIPRTTPNQAIAQYLRSTRLTTLLKLTRSPHASQDRPLTVSLSDLGSPEGFPLVVFLGLGCVRHVMGLYDEMAECLGLRLITIDRWGLGRTDVPRSKSSRGIMEWASIVEEVLDLLKISQCSVMAHSAGAPYALSFANRAPERIVGDICLLAPWVGGSEGGGYKWLKYVPNGILKTAQAAEWKVQAWMIGKPPTIAYEGIGYTAKSVSASPGSKSPLGRRSPQNGHDSGNLGVIYPSSDSKPRPSIGSRSIGSSIFSDYDKLSDFDGRFESHSTLGAKRDSQYSRAVSEGNGSAKKRKPSKGFLGKFKGTSTSQPQSPADDNSSPRRLKALRSMGSLKGKSSSAPNSTSKKLESSPQLPQPLLFDGLGFTDIDWTKPIATETSTPVSSKTFRAGDTSSTLGKSSSGRGSRTGGRRSISFSAPRPSSPSLPSSPTASTFSTPFTNAAPGVSYQATLGNALIAASHAESSKGTHSDLVQILNHDHQPWGFSYSSYPHKVQVWYGDKDEKIAENAVRWMERNMGDERCSVKVVRGADHSLMYKSAVVVEVLERIREYW